MHMIKPQKSLFTSLGLFILLFSLPLHSEESAPPAAPTEETTQSTETSAEDTTQSTEAPTEGTTQSTETPAESAAAKSEHVLRSLLTTGIEDREPVDEIVSLNKNQERIYFFTEFADLEGKIIKHRWDYKGQTMGEVNFNVGSNKWRCYSSKNLLPEWTGIWTVSIIDENDQVLAETYFEVTE